MNLKNLCAIAGIILLSAVSCGAQNAPKPEVFYTVTVVSYERETLRVAMTIEAPAEEKIAVAIPAWAPGYYQIAHYEKNISNVTAADGNHKPLPVRHTEARTWETDRPAGAEKVVFEYDVHADDKGYGFFGSRLYASGGYINGPSAFLYYVGHTDAAAHLIVEAKGAKQAAAALTSFGSNVGKTSDFMYHADSYDELVDTPIQFGKFKEIDFSVDGTPFRIAALGDWTVDKTKAVDALTKIAKAAKAVFGAFPFHDYLFVYHIGGAGFEGGLEHRNSTVIHIPKTTLTPDDDFVTISAHEFFHAWNIKRLHPAALTPLDYTKEARTGSLWFAEGVTDYYSYLLPVRAGLRPPAWFLTQIADTMNEQETTPTRRSESLEDASRRTWEEENDLTGEGLSYYIKGSLAGLYFDLRIRELTNGAASLDDVMRELDKTYGKPNLGYPEDAVLTAINKIAHSDLTDEYNRYTKGTDDIEWDGVFAGAGLTLQREKVPSLGIATEGSKDAATEFSPVVKKIFGGLSGEKLGLKLGDMVQNVNGVAVTQSSFGGSIKNLKPGSALAMDVLRDGKIVHLQGETGFRWNITKITPAPDGGLSAPALRIRKLYFAAQEAR